jgi:glycosyltransferase involved in cell wall biosynthesis
LPETILLINHYAGSPRDGMEFRPYYLARHWVRMGYRVVIAAASFSHVRRTNPRMRGSEQRETIDGITYIWLRTPMYRGNGVGRVLNMLAFTWQLLRRWRALADRESLAAVISSSTYPLDIYPAARIARRARAHLIFEVHDLWPLSPIELGGYSRSHPFIVLMQAAEDYAYRIASHVVSMLPKALPYMMEHGLEPAKFVHIPNGVELELQDRGEALGEDVAAVLPPAGDFLVGYAGTVGIANALDALVEAAAILQETPEIRFAIVGDGPELERLQGEARARDLRNLHFIGRIEKGQVPAMLARFDVCYIGLKAEKLFRFGVSPNKLFDYMLAARPVLQAISAGNDPVGESGCGMSVEPENPRAIADAVLAFYHMSPEERQRLGDNGRRYVLEHHTYEKLARQFAELFRH